MEGASRRTRAWRSGEPEKHPLRQRSLATLAKRWWDDQAALRSYTEEAAQIESLEPGEDPYKYAQVFTHSAPAAARDAIDHGVWSLVTNRRLSGGLREAFKHLGDITWEELEEFTDFIAARHAIEVEQSGRASGLPLDDARWVVAKYQGRPGFVDAAATITAWHKALVHMLTEVGRISPEAERLITQTFPAYVPFKRVLDDRVKMARQGIRGYNNPKNPVKRMKGSGRDIINPLLTSMQMAEQFYQAAIQTMVGRSIVDLAYKDGAREGLGRFVSRIPPPTETLRFEMSKIANQLNLAGADLNDADLTAIIALTRPNHWYNGTEPLMVVYEDGRPQWYQIDKELFAVIGTVEPTQLPYGLETSIVGKVLKGATRLKRMGATELRARFAIFWNPMRDFFTYSNRSEGLSPTAPLRLLGSIVHQLHSIGMEVSGKGKDPIIELFDRYGGELSGMVGQDLKHAYKTVQEVVRSAQGRGWINRFKHPIETVRTFMSIMEKSPRLAEFELVLKKYGWDRARLKTGDVPPVGMVVEAAFAAMNVTTNFKRAGDIGRLVNKINAYQNAKIQDLVQDYRMFQDHPARSFVRGIMWLTVPSILYWWAVKDEDWYQELPSWQRLTCWNFKIGDTVLPIPSPFLLGMIFSHLPVAILDSLYRKHPGRVKEWLEGLRSEYVPDWSSILPDAIEPALEVAINYSFFSERPVVSEELAEYEGKDQSYAWNTSASKYLGFWLNRSPAKIDHLIHGYTGGIGTDILHIGDRGWSRVFGQLTRPLGRGDAVDEFYDRFGVAKQRFNSAKAGEKRGDKSIDPAIEERYRKLNETNELMKEVNAAARLAKTDEERYEIQRYATGLARFALGKSELPYYPNPLTAEDLPAKIREARNLYLGRKVWDLTDEPPEKLERMPRETDDHFEQRKTFHQQSIDRAKNLLIDHLDMSQEDLESYLKQHAPIRNPNAKNPAAVWLKGTESRRLSSYGRRKNRLDD